jgi:hypothetical protein
MFTDDTGIDFVLTTAYFKRTQAEINKSIVPVDLRFHAGNLYRYGGVGDDSTDNWDAIDDALTQAEDPLGSPVHIPQGIFRSNNRHVLTAARTGITIYGDGYQSVIRLTGSHGANNKGLFTIEANGDNDGGSVDGADYITIDNVRLEGSLATFTSGVSAGIRCFHGVGHIFRNLWVHEFSDQAILLQSISGSADFSVQVQNAYLYDQTANAGKGIGIESATTDVARINIDTVYCYGNGVAGVGGRGINIGSGSATINNAHCYGNGVGGIKVSGNDNQHVIFNNCNLSDNTNAAASGFTTTGTFRCLQFNNCIFDNNGDHGLEIAHAGKVFIDNCYMRGNGDIGLIASAGELHLGSIVAENNVNQGVNITGAEVFHAGNIHTEANGDQGVRIGTNGKVHINSIISVDDCDAGVVANAVQVQPASAMSSLYIGAIWAEDAAANVTTALHITNSNVSNAIIGKIEVSSITTELSDAGVNTQRLDHRFPRTPEEVTAGKVPVDYGFPSGHIQRWGGVGDGVANDTTPFLDAYATDGHPYIPNGTWSIANTSEVDLNGDDKYVFFEPGAIIDYTTNGMGFVINGANIHWYGGLIRGTGAVTTTATDRNPSMLMVDGDAEVTRRNIHIEKVRVEEANHSGIGVYRGVGVSITDCEVVDDSGSSSVARFGIWANDSAHIHIRDNTVDGFGTCIGGGGNSGAYTWDSYDGQTGSGDQRSMTIDGNHLHNFADHGVYFSDYNIGYSVTNNKTYGGGSKPLKVEGDWIVVKDNIMRDASGGITGRANRQIVIAGNVVEATDTGSAVYGIRVGPDNPFNHDLEEVTITDNILKSTNTTGAGNGIEVDGISNSTDYNIKRLIVSGNTIEGYWCKLDTNPGGIYIRVGQTAGTTALIDSCIVHGNIVDLNDGHTNNNRGISLLFKGTHVSVKDNIVKGFVQHGLYCDGQDFLNIDGNHFKGRAASTVNGIRCEVDCDDVRIGTNHFEDCDTEVNVPAAIGAWRSVRVIEGSLAWDPADVADGATVNNGGTTITGAAIDDPVVVGNSIDRQGLILHAKVTSADTVTVYYTNPTGANVNLGTDNYWVRVFKKD